VSQRERWIIYPLLFFCFCMCIKLYWYPEYRDIDPKTVTTQQLILKDEDGRDLLTAGGQPNGDGYLRIFAAPPQDAAGRAPLEAVRLAVSPSRNGVVAAFSGIGQPVVELTGDGRGGNVSLFDPNGRRISVHMPESDPRTAPPRPPVPPTAPSIGAPPTAVGSDAT
jgi:hypothetical protein